MTVETLTETRSPQRIRAESLLHFYPDVDGQECEEIQQFLDKGPILEIGLMSGDPALKLKMDRFRQENAAAFRLGVGKQIALMLMLCIPFIALCWYIWDSGAKR
ncbi:hypothetical protein [Sphingobium boeckii]|uniref:Uncharacterized protein n=1 Tax=Sphingobium boeckii TaxID=1082345 RepID=A0A7W9AF13_9SPHN|nr:hypothetical protein [Sphingobium boeckii]MBB5684420.1 hypothetical protein [Sphingobium boeckii]